VGECGLFWSYFADNMSVCVLSMSYCKDNVNVDYLRITVRKMWVVECGLSGYYYKDNMIGEVGIVLELLQQ
jgi:hypothetical protein